MEATARRPILVVEDEQSIADSIIYALESDGFAPMHVTTGLEAMKRLKAQSFDLSVLDVGLPDMNGFDLCRQIKQEKQAMPVIFLTARSSEVDRIVGLEIGANDYMVKPFSPRELTARVRALLRFIDVIQSHPAAEILRGKEEKIPFQLDRERCLITFFGQALDLSRQEYRILAVMINRPGMVFSRDKLMEMAWDSPESSFDRTVDTHIKTIRAKLNAIHPDANAVVTHRGLGYSLKVSW